MSGPEYVERSGLAVDIRLVDFVEHEAVPAAKVDPDVVWAGLARVVAELGPRNRELLAERTRLQDVLDEWHRERVGQPIDPDEYRALLTELGYLVPAGEPFTIDTLNVDDEIATLAGPQLVVPASNARYALNAANARWGSLYDALYGTDALGSTPPAGPYDDARGAEVVAWTRAFLDRAVPLANGSHANADRYAVFDGALAVAVEGAWSALVDPSAFTGWTGPADDPSSVLLTHHGLGVEIVFDSDTPVGRTDIAGVSDVVIESAVTTIVDFEDSVAAVDAEDKVTCYRNWLGLMTGELAEEVSKGGQSFTRRLNPERTIGTPEGSERAVRPHALLLARNVGHLMTTPAVRDADGHEIPEGLLDAVITVLAALVDVGPSGRRVNSPAGSVYIVKPKMHGPDEVAFADAIFTVVEEVFELPPNTVKIGIMDEERRTTVNLAECIRAARSRVAFINTGFLDRTGDEIHTSMQAGPMVRKADMKAQPWITAYEDNNVDVGLACGLQGRAQIGKGMWAAPDRMQQMLTEKGGHPRAGASCAWVPSPTAATLHATHYHEVDVAQRQSELAAGGSRAQPADLLTIPIEPDRPWSEDDIDAEVQNNAQGILGYVVRWVDQGVGCSKVPDLSGVELMEDRATCRISSQHIANWLHHDVVTLDRVDAALRKMAAIVDEQNGDDPHYEPMAPSFDGEAFHAARDLIVEGLVQPAGYTEPLLHRHRQVRKSRSVEAR
ncbi:malate synthase G [uncultured Jatrophihabitans sp.]|uniref:malate synthase G n=1 Tax=uncultured Jatrophihabitans sp. TaxID=1610747 RepID=UPI0035CC71AF